MAIGRILFRSSVSKRGCPYLGRFANKRHLESRKASRKLRFPHGSHANSAWQNGRAKAPENMAKIRSWMSFSDLRMTYLDVDFPTLAKSDIPRAETDATLGNVRLSC
jgi:hypothetical protein